jgi:hypothetical protein
MNEMMDWVFLFILFYDDWQQRRKNTIQRAADTHNHVDRQVQKKYGRKK